MRSRQTFFFAEREDMEPIIAEVEREMDVWYVRAGYSDEPGATYYESLTQIDRLGYVDKGSWSDTDRYLILPAKKEVRVRRISLYAGGYRYAIDQSENQQSLGICLSGIYKTGVIVAGKLGTISEHPFSLAVLQHFSKLIKKQFSPHCSKSSFKC